MYMYMRFFTKYPESVSKGSKQNKSCAVTVIILNLHEMNARYPVYRTVTGQAASSRKKMSPTVLNIDLGTVYTWFTTNLSGRTIIPVRPYVMLTVFDHNLLTSQLKPIRSEAITQ